MKVRVSWDPTLKPNIKKKLVIMHLNANGEAVSLIGYEINSEALRKSKKIVKHITRDDKWFTWVIKFHNNSTYNWNQSKGNSVKDFKYSYLRNIAKDINSKTKRILKETIQEFNVKHYGSKNTIGLRYNKIKYIGFIECSSLISSKVRMQNDFGYLQKSCNLHMGWHVHYVVRNETALSPKQITDKFTQASNNTLLDNWRLNIRSTTHPKQAKVDYSHLYDELEHKNYHHKQNFSLNSYITNIRK